MATPPAAATPSSGPQQGNIVNGLYTFYQRSLQEKLKLINAQADLLLAEADVKLRKAEAEMMEVEAEERAWNLQLARIKMERPQVIAKVPAPEDGTSRNQLDEDKEVRNGPGVQQFAQAPVHQEREPRQTEVVRRVMPPRAAKNVKKYTQ